MSDPEPAVVRVTAGRPDAEELAALLAVLAARRHQRRSHSSAEAARTSSWADRAALLRARPAPGPGGWRADARPR